MKTQLKIFFILLLSFVILSTCEELSDQEYIQLHIKGIPLPQSYGKNVLECVLRFKYKNELFGNAAEDDSYNLFNEFANETEGLAGYDRQIWRLGNIEDGFYTYVPSYFSCETTEYVLRGIIKKYYGNSDIEISIFAEKIRSDNYDDLVGDAH